MTTRKVSPALVLTPSRVGMKEGGARCRAPLSFHVVACLGGELCFSPNGRNLNRLRPPGREYDARDGHRLLREILESSVLPVARHRRRRRQVQRAVIAEDRERD